MAAARARGALVLDETGRLLLVLQPRDPEDFGLLPGRRRRGQPNLRRRRHPLGEETGFVIPEHALAVHGGVALDPRTGTPILHVEVVWKARVVGWPHGPAELPWRFLTPADIPPEVDLSPELRRVLGLGSPPAAPSGPGGTTAARTGP